MYLLIGDLHLTDNARDAYRFEIFDWIAKQQAKRDPIVTFLAGDLTDAKDRHSATLVNKVVEGLLKLKPPVYVCLGNHDYRDPNNPFFKFLNHIEGITFVCKPTITKLNGVAIIPHVRTQEEFDAAAQAVHNRAAGRIGAYLVHQTFDGAIAESGTRLSGLSASLVESFGPPLGVYAGDVHKPQRQGIVTYVGCPYQVRFGDNFQPRVLWVTEDRDVSLYFPAPRKWSLEITSTKDLVGNKELFEGDQVKIKVNLSPDEAVSWQELKKNILFVCKQKHLQVYGLSLELEQPKTIQRIMVQGNNHANTFKQFAKSENLAKLVEEVGLSIMEETNGN